MNAFAETWKRHQNKITTENGAATYDTSADVNVDLFFHIGALRGQPKEKLYSLFANAFGEDPVIATRIMLWARDAREGAGERQIFRDLLNWLETNEPDVLLAVLPKVPELGRWDDLLVLKTPRAKSAAFQQVAIALRGGDSLCAKWMPRKGPIANELRKFFGLTPKQYRKVLVSLTNVVETQMCSGDWSKIDYQKVPSVATSRYNKAFLKHDETRYREFGEKAKAYASAMSEAQRTGDTSKLEKVEKVKVNVGAVYPYDVLKSIVNNPYHHKVDLNVVRAQWLSLPNYVGNKNMLPMVDVSESMFGMPVNNDGLVPVQIAVSLGLYLASKNTGPFHNMLLSFTDNPSLVTFHGEDIVNHVDQFNKFPKGYNTNLARAMQAIVDHAVKNRVPSEQMPEFLLVLSDMQFDAFRPHETAMENARRAFEQAGYKCPKIVWWNIQSRGTDVPVKFDQTGAALVSGFSPTIAKNIMSGAGFSPVNMMLKVIMDPRYDIDLAA